MQTNKGSFPRCEWARCKTQVSHPSNRHRPRQRRTRSALTACAPPAWPSGSARAECCARAQRV